MEGLFSTGPTPSSFVILNPTMQQKPCIRETTTPNEGFDIIAPIPNQFDIYVFFVMVAFDIVFLVMFIFNIVILPPTFFVIVSNISITIIRQIVSVTHYSPPKKNIKPKTSKITKKSHLLIFFFFTQRCRLNKNLRCALAIFFQI